MKQTRTILLMVVSAMMFTLTVRAQFPADVKEVLKKCEEKMGSYNTPAGVVFDMDMKLKVSILKVNGTMKTYAKEKKYFNILTMQFPEHEFKMEIGFDGTQKWLYKSSMDEDKKDSLVITKTQSAKNDYAMNLGYEKEYNKARMKEEGRYYEITFSGPKKKDLPKKSSIKIAKDSYLLREYSVDMDMGPFAGRMILTITKITKGCSDHWLKLDMNRYKNAVVVRH